MMSHKKKLLASDWYHCTIRDARILNGLLRLTFTVDRGDHAYRNIIEKFSNTTHGKERLTTLFSGINFIVINDWDSHLLYKQFTNNKLRVRANIGRQIKGSVVVNRVIELQPPEKPEDYNVLKPKDDTFYQQGNKGKQLPLQ